MRGKRLGGVDGNGVQIAAQRVAQESDGHDGACAVHRIQRHAEMALADAGGIHVAEHALDVQARGGGVVAGGAADLFVGGAAEIALMIQVQQFAALVAVEEQAFGVEELEGVVFRRIVGGGDGDAAARAGCAHVDLEGGRGQDADVHDFAAGRQQPQATAWCSISPLDRVSRPTTTRPAPT
jgi:hypothetical protein